MLCQLPAKEGVGETGKRNGHRVYRICDDLAITEKVTAPKDAVTFSSRRIPLEAFMQTVESGTRIALKNILFATDFSPCSNAALPYAFALARRYGVRLHAAYVKPNDADLLFMSPETWPAVMEEEDKRIKLHIEELEKQIQGLPHEVLTPKGKVADALARIVEEHEIDLLVLGTHGRSGVGKLFLGSVAEEIFRRSTCPVLSVGPNVPSKPNNGIQFHNIVFATDFSEDSLAALPYAIFLAEEDQAQLALLHVIEQPAAGIADLEEVKESLLRRLRELVPPEAEPWCHAECLLEFGRQFAPPAEQIVEVAGNHAADLIVLGLRPVHGALGLGTHLASTTAQILTQAACPVLTVRRMG
jgi:nucleotide-binding universal stress UspA family protein